MKDMPVVPPVVQQDTTSHLINWIIDDLGGGVNSSTLYDCAIENDSSIYAVGEVYMVDSLGYPDPNIYNLVRWNGSAWVLSRLQFFTFCGQSYTGSYPTKSIIVFGKNDILISFGSQVTHYNGKNQLKTECIPVSVNKLWGTTSNNLYAVGNNGGIAHYQNGVWTKLESGTDVNLRDVWGSPDGSVVWAAGFEDSYGTVFLRSTSSGFEKVLEISSPNIPHPINQITHVFKSLWTDKADTVYLGAIGRVYATPKNTTGYAKENIWWDYANQTKYPPETNIIRGTAGNDIFVAGYLQSIRHWNGASWKDYPEIEGDGTWRGMTVKGNLVIAVGENFSTGNAIIAIGYRITN